MVSEPERRHCFWTIFLSIIFLSFTSLSNGLPPGTDACGKRSQRLHGISLLPV